MVDVILLERIERLGQMGDVVSVRPGYARNYLLPQKKALRATSANKAAFEQRKAQLVAENLQRREEAQAVSGKLVGLSVAIVRQAGETGQLYGSVTTRDIAVAITEAGFTVNKAQVVIDQPIKTSGLREVRVMLHPEVIVPVHVAVAPTLDEAKALIGGSRATPTEDAAEADEVGDADA